MQWRSGTFCHIHMSLLKQLSGMAEFTATLPPAGGLREYIHNIADMAGPLGVPQACGEMFVGGFVPEYLLHLSCH